MTTIVLLTLLIWGVAVGAWFLISRAFRSSDLKQIRSRLAGRDRGEKKKSLKPGPSLLSLDDPTQGRVIGRLLKKFELTPRVEELLEQAGLKWKVSRLTNMCLFLGLVAFFAGWQLLGSYRNFAFLFALAAGSLPVFFVIRKRNQRLHKFEEQFPESLEFVARSMRAGHAFSVSLEMIHREFQEPLAGEFRRTFEEHNLGMPLDVALQKLAKRVPSLDVHFFVSAVMLQKRTGGNLAEILDKLAYVIRERFKLRGKIRAISAHGRMTGAALSSIPIAVAGLMFIANREYISFFIEDEIGHYMAFAAIALQGVGYAIIQKIVSIEV